MNPKKTKSYIYEGFWLLMAWHLMAEAVLLMLALAVSVSWHAPIRVGGYPLEEWILLSMVFIGATQVVYAVPLGAWFFKKRRFEKLKGIVLCFALTALLNGSCYVILLNGW